MCGPLVITMDNLFLCLKATICYFYPCLDLKISSSEHGGRSIDTHNIDFDFISMLQIQTYKDLYVPDLNVMYRKISSIIQEVL